MGTQACIDSHTWSIVLAGGEGTRLASLIQRWLGQKKPKQYCAFVGTRSMFEHTLDRAVHLASPDRIVTVVARTHGEYALGQIKNRSSGTVLFQPANRDTAAGIFLPLTYIRSRDPNATVVIYPSDHFVYPEGPFLNAVHHAVLTAHRFYNHLVLLGISPDGLELQYGWIQPAQSMCIAGGYPVHAVRAFWEKPTRAEALAVQTAGGLWNTFVMAVNVKTLWELGWFCFPKMMYLFEKLRRAIGTSQEGTVLESIYQKMPEYNFSSDLLQRVPHHIAVLEVPRILWSDWGHPDRVATTLRRIGKSPKFPVELLES